MKAAQPSRRKFRVVEGHKLGGKSTAAIVYTPSDGDEVLDPRFAEKLLVSIANDISEIGQISADKPRRGTKLVRTFGIALIVFAKGTNPLETIKAVRRSLSVNFRRMNPGFMADKQRERARRQAARTLIATELADLGTEVAHRSTPRWMTPSFTAAGNFANRNR